MNPPWLAKAYTYMGLKEIPGPKHNSTILGWLAKLGAWWQDDETAWCGTFVAHCLQTMGQPVPKDWYRAKAWASYGSRLQASRIAPGALLIFGRTGGGHIGFYVGENTRYYYVAGGNQSNGVSVTRIAKDRILKDADNQTIGIRWPKGVPVLGGPVMMTEAGIPVSTNEA